MRFTVLGAGAIGGVIAARLFQSRADVRVVARGAHAEAIGRSGLRLRSPSGDVTLPIPVIDSSAGLDALAVEDDEVVILAVKSNATADLIGELAERVPATTTVVCAQNGVDNERVALRSFAPVLGMCVMMPAEHLEPGVVVAYCDPIPGLLDVGGYPSGANTLVDDVAGALTGAGFESVVRPDIMRWKHSKLLMNLGNVLQAAYGDDPQVAGVGAAARREARACFEAAGIEWASSDEDRERRGDLLQWGQIDGADRGGGSTWQSLARSTGRLETDHLNGEIVLLGRLHGVATPVNEALVALGRTLVAEGAAPGTADPTELVARFGS